MNLLSTAVTPGVDPSVGPRVLVLRAHEPSSVDDRHARTPYLTQFRGEDAERRTVAPAGATVRISTTSKSGRRNLRERVGDLILRRGDMNLGLRRPRSAGTPPGFVGSKVT